MSRAPGIMPLSTRLSKDGTGSLQEALVVAQHELAVDLAHQLECHTDGDQHGGARNGKFWTSNNHKRMYGVMAITATNNAPGRVIRLTALDRYRSVCGPGRTPGMKPPCRRI